MGKAQKEPLTRDECKALANGWYHCTYYQKPFAYNSNGGARVHKPATEFSIQGVIADIKKDRLRGRYVVRAWSAHKLEDGAWDSLSSENGTPVQILFSTDAERTAREDGGIEIRNKQNELIDVKIRLYPYSESPPWPQADSPQEAGTEPETTELKPENSTVE